MPVTPASMPPLHLCNPENFTMQKIRGNPLGHIRENSA
jgi:hypothetical protein